MYSFKICLANKRIQISCYYKHVVSLCKDYYAFFNKPDFLVESDIDFMQEAISSCSEKWFFDALIKKGIAVEHVSLESFFIYRKIAEKMLDYNIILLHGAAIAIKNRSYVFMAPSGTGKTTHVLNWKKIIPETVVINGDKPLVDVDQKLIFGTPWCGKEGFNTNSSATIAGLISLERGLVNHISPTTFHEILPALIQQTYIPKDADSAIKVYHLLGELNHIPCYKLTCNMDVDAALVAYEGIKRHEKSLYVQ